ncbi:hypothetical protein K7432_012190 [Basidiobolus ranarum]|uniref:Uncharacterized protein n=1 Tax=Basidiobolus ranarum TaxID=34480 RepID=A0ABR2WLB1_9FUNG
MLLKSILCTLLSAAALVNAGFVDSKGKHLLHGSRYYIEECGAAFCCHGWSLDTFESQKRQGKQEILHFDGRGEPLFISGTRDEESNCYELYQTKQNGDKVVDIRLAENGHSNLQLGGNKWIASVRFLFASAY